MFFSKVLGSFLRGEFIVFVVCFFFLRKRMKRL